MSERNTPRKTLETWKQIAAYLDRSERTVRRWETCEGLPVHRHGHERQDTVFAYRHEVEAWSRLRTRCPGPPAVGELEIPLLANPANAYLLEHDAITRTMHCYIAGARAGDGDLMRPAFHPLATLSGYCQGSEYTGSIEHVFQWITAKGPAPQIQARFARIEIIETIAVVHLEVQRWSGKLVGAYSRATTRPHGPASSSRDPLILERARILTGHATGTPLIVRQKFSFEISASRSES
jgi:hypothetical protein